jgi:hypothetical protein
MFTFEVRGVSMPMAWPLKRSSAVAAVAFENIEQNIARETVASTPAPS